MHLNPISLLDHCRTQLQVCFVDIILCFNFIIFCVVLKLKLIDNVNHYYYCSFVIIIYNLILVIAFAAIINTIYSILITFNHSFTHPPIDHSLANSLTLFYSLIHSLTTPPIYSGGSINSTSSSGNNSPYSGSNSPSSGKNVPLNPRPQLKLTRLVDLTTCSGANTQIPLLTIIGRFYFIF